MGSTLRLKSANCQRQQGAFRPFLPVLLVVMLAGLLGVCPSAPSFAAPADEADSASATEPSETSTPVEVEIAPVESATGTIVTETGLVEGATASVQFAPPAEADVVSVEDVLARIERTTAEVKSLSTSFTQEKNLAAFRNKVVIKGRIYLRKPGRLAWHVTEPIRYSVLITDKIVRQWDEETDKVNEIAIDKIPVMRSMLEQMKAWFTGEYTALLKGYDATLLQEAPAVIKFTPKDEGMVAKIIKSVTIRLRADERYLHRITIEEKGGDSTTITFTDTEINPQLKAADFEVKGRV